MKNFSILMLLSMLPFNHDTYAGTFSSLSIKTKYKKQEIVVCFADDINILHETPLAFNKERDSIVSFPDELKERFRLAVQSSFTTHTTGISFYGWDSCTKTTNPDVVIFYSKSLRASMSAGCLGDPLEDPHYENSERKKINSIVINEGYVNLNNDSINRITESFSKEDPGILAQVQLVNHHSVNKAVVHEFGHVAGLAHEHFRPDSTDRLKETDISKDEIVSDFYIETRDFVKKTIKDLNLKSYELKNVGSYSLFSTMDYSWQSFWQELLRQELFCKKPEHNLSEAAFETLCDKEKLALFSGTPDPVTGYLHKSDVEGLRYLYKGDKIQDSWVKAEAPVIAWLKEVKSLRKEYPQLYYIRK